MIFFHSFSITQESVTGDIKPSNIRHLVAVVAVQMLIIIAVFLNLSGPIPKRTIRPTIDRGSYIIYGPTQDLPITVRIASNAIGVVLMNESTVGLLSSNGSWLGTSEPINFRVYNSEVFFTVKSTAKNHGPRLSLLLVTWLQTVDPSQVCRIKVKGRIKCF